MRFIRANLANARATCGRTSSGRWRSCARRIDVVVAEGAGAAVEPNLREGDIVNLRVARSTGAVVLLVADIDRGGAFGHLVGTLELMSADERSLVRGLVLNRFRGDASQLNPAIVEVEERTGVPVLGVIPWIENVRIAEEDAVALERVEADGTAAGTVDIAVVHLPRIANFDDFDALQLEAGVSVRFVTTPEDLGDPQLIVLPGTKATIADLEAMRSRGTRRGDPRAGDVGNAGAGHLRRLPDAGQVGTRRSGGGGAGGVVGRRAGAPAGRNRIYGDEDDASVGR